MKRTKKYITIDREKDTAIIIVANREKSRVHINTDTVNANIYDLAFMKEILSKVVTKFIEEKMKNE